MASVVIFGGTTEGRKLAEAFRNTELELHICVATEYGGSLLPDSDNIHIHAGRLTAQEMKQLFETTGAELCLDATHPYATAVTENIVCACEERRLPYFRVLREQEAEPHGSEEAFLYVDSVEEAAEYLKTTEGKILLTTGSKELEKYTVIPGYQERCIARVLPTLQVMEKCGELGFQGKNLIAMQGPFSEELNYHICLQHHCSYLVTKESGKEGGFEEKCSGALRAGTKVVVVRRPTVEEEAKGEKTAGTAFEASAMTLDDAIQKLCSIFHISFRRKVYLIGMGPGKEELLTEEAKRCLEESDVLIGAERLLSIWKKAADKPLFNSYKKEEIISFLGKHPEYRTAALVYSGDIGFYSGARDMAGLLPEYDIRPVTGISSPIYLLNRLGLAWQEIPFASCHGQSTRLIPTLLCRGRVCALIGRGEEVSSLCNRLLDFGMEDVKLAVGQRLSYPEEKIVTGTPRTLASQTFDGLSVLYLELIKEPEAAAYWRKAVPGIPDEAFLRDKVPMTKYGIRVLSLGKLKLKEDSVVYDVGAGTGSVSIEAAVRCKKGMVYAIEQKPEAVELIQKNRKRFCAENLEVIEGTAPECLEALPAPTHAFIGGSGGRLEEIIEAVRRKNPKVRFVINAVTLETLGQLSQLSERFPEYGKMDVLQAGLSVSRPLGRYHIMSGENPVFIVTLES